MAGNRLFWMVTPVAILTLLSAGCSTTGAPSSSPSSAITTTPSPVSQASSPLPPTPSPTLDPAVDDSEAAGGLPNSEEPRAACLQAMAALEGAGADTLEPEDPAIAKTLTACRTVAEWRGGLEAAPGALGYESAGELNEQTLRNDLQVVCLASLKTPVCKEAIRRKLL